MWFVILAGCPARVPTSVEVPGTPVPAAPSDLIADEECVARGGRVITEQTYADLDRARAPGEVRTPFRVCHVPSPNNGRACSDAQDCAGGICWCTGELARPNPMDDPALAPLDGTSGTGICDDEPIPSGEWRCLVSGGLVHLSGIIVD